MPGQLTPSPFAAQVGSKFRGDWSLGELAYGLDFTGGVPGEFTGGGQQASLGSLGATPRPGFSDVLQMRTSEHGILDTSGVPELAGKSLTQVSFWWAGENGWIDPGPKFYVDGVLKATCPTVSYSSGPAAKGAWEHKFISLSGSDPVFEWFCDGYDSLNVTGLQVMVAADPYMLGEFVLYKGKMWKSLVDDNSAQPNQSDSWERIATNYNTTYATADRPDAASAGAGASIYDSTLLIPLFSNGTAWTNASGTVV